MELNNQQKIYKELKTLVLAEYPIIYVVSHEEDRVIETINEIATNLSKKVYFWDCVNGFVGTDNQAFEGSSNPMVAISAAEQMKADEEIIFVSLTHPTKKQNSSAGTPPL